MLLRTLSADQPTNDPALGSRDCQSDGATQTVDQKSAERRQRRRPQHDCARLPKSTEADHHEPWQNQTRRRWVKLVSARHRGQDDPAARSAPDGDACRRQRRGSRRQPRRLCVKSRKSWPTYSQGYRDCEHRSGRQPTKGIWALSPAGLDPRGGRFLLCVQRGGPQPE